MYFEQFYLACLSHASYMIGSEGVAAVVDPPSKLSTSRAASMPGGLAIYHTRFHIT